MSANILWLRRPATDRPCPGGRQEFLARRNDRRTGPASASRCPADSRRRRTPSGPSSPTTISTSASSTAWRRWTSRTSRACPRPARRSAAGSSMRRCRPISTSDIRAAYAKLSRTTAAATSPSRVRSSATAEDLPDASFAGQQETFLNVTGADDVRAQGQGSLRLALQRSRDRLSRAPRLQARGRVPVRRRAADGALGRRRVRRAVHARYRIRLPRRGVHHRQLRPRRKRRAGRGESGRVLRLQADAARRASPRSCAARSAPSRSAWCIPTSPASACATKTRRPNCATRSRISDADVQELAKQALVIEQHYGRPMDIEWAKDGVSGKLFIVQARPETVKSRGHATQIERLHAARSAARSSPKAARSARRSAPARRASCARSTT